MPEVSGIPGARVPGSGELPARKAGIQTEVLCKSNINSLLLKLLSRY